MSKARDLASFVSTPPTTGGSVKLREASDNGSNFVELQAPDTLASDVSLTLPSGVGTNGQALLSDGSGGLSFGDVDSLPSQSGQSGKYLTTDGTTASWGTVDTSAAGNDTELQYNNAGARAGAAGLTTDGSNLTINTEGELRFGDSDDSNYVGFKAPATIAADKIWTLPDADGTNGQVLSTNGSGTLSWASGAAPGPVADGSAASPSITFSSDTNTGIFRRTTDTLAFTTAGTQRAQIDSGGVFSISTTTGSTLAQKMVLQGTGWGGGNGSGINGSPLPQVVWSGFSLDNSGSVNPVGFQLIGGGGGVPRGFIMATYGRGRQTSKEAMFFTTNVGNSDQATGLGAPVAGVYRGSIDATTYAPNNSFPFAYGNGGMTSFGVYDNAVSDYDGTSKAGIQVRLAGSYGGGSPGAWGGACYTASISTNFGSGSTGTNFGYRANITGAGSGNNWGIYIDNGGAAKPGGGSWSSTSDARVKTVSGNYENGLEKVLQLNPVNFTYNGKGGHSSDGKNYIGLIAQDVQPVFPEMISSRMDKLNEDDEEDTEILMLDNSSLIYARVNSVKELSAKCDALEARIAALENQP